jgi:cytoskeleton protein RodZ
MNDQITSDQTHSRPVLLRQAREAAGLHIAALAAALKVPVKKLEALESGRYDELPDLTFARALASSACRQLKIEPGPVLAQIPVGHQTALGDAGASINAPFKPVGGAPAADRGAWMRRPAVLVSLLLLAGAGGLALMPDWDFRNLSMPAFVSERLDRGAQETPGVAATAPATSQQATSAASNGQEAAAPAPLPEASPAVAAAVAVAPPPAPSNSVLHIEATGESWVEVVDGAGRSQVQRMMKPGEVLDFSALPPYSVVVGRADAVTVNVRGQLFDLAPYARNSVARFQVK